MTKATGKGSGAGGAARPRDLILFLGSFKLKSKQLAAAHDRAAAFLRAFTPFAGWDEATLRVHTPTRTRATEALLEYVRRAPDGVDRRAHHEQTFDREALRARRIDLDEVGEAALATFGPAQFTSMAASEQGHWCALTWMVRGALPPPEWLAFCAEHAGRKLDSFDVVEVVTSVHRLELLDPQTRAPLPFQSETCYPPLRTGDTYRLGCEASAHLRLPRREVSLTLRLPFEEPDGAFADYVEQLDAALGQPLSRKHWYSVLANKGGTGQYERKLSW